MNSEFKENQLRITALWAFSEAFLGGILHALKMPFSGLVLAAFAVICICALTLPKHEYGSILKATILVIIVKAILSPYTPLAAYFAVFLQGAFAEIIFAIGITYRISAFILSIFALMQSAIQKVIILIILFGVDFWKAIDQFLNSVTKEMGFSETSYSLYIVITYLSMYLLMGIITGMYAVRLPKIIAVGQMNFKSIDSTIFSLEIEKNLKNKKKTSLLFWILAIFAIVILGQSYMENGIFAMIESKAIKLIIRALILTFFWYFIITPILRKLFNRWLENTKNKFSKEINQLLQLMPEMKAIAIFSWKATAKDPYFKRINKSIGLIFFQLQRNEN